MSYKFREFLKKVGSGSHTSKDLSREEAATAMEMVLQKEATPDQIGAFLIAHRIKRPTAAELAGMLDTYDRLSPQLSPIQSEYPVAVLNCPYDGRSRTAPVTPIVALMLVTVGIPVVMHGGDRMATKYGIPTSEVWQQLGLDWTNLSLSQLQTVFESTHLAFFYQPRHFPLSADLVSYRDRLGKRPPIATIELMHSPYKGNSHLFCGFVHPPTEEFFKEAFSLRGTNLFTTVKGLEGSCDLPRERTAIIGLFDSNSGFSRLHLHPQEYGFFGHNVPLEDEAEFGETLRSLLAGTPSELLKTAIWNGGFYLWRCGICNTIEQGIDKAKLLLADGAVRDTLEKVKQAIANE